MPSSQSNVVSMPRNVSKKEKPGGIQYPLKFQAAILERNNQPLVVDEVVFEGPLMPGQVLVRIHYSGICGKQIEEIRGSAGVDSFLPHMLGHEGSGVVADVGPEVRKVVAGDHVVLHWLKGSGIDATTPLYKRNGKRVNAGWVTTFNEYGVVAENRVTVIPKEVDLSVACLLGCAVTTGVGVVVNEANVRPGESIAVFGCGGVGLNAVQGAALVKAALVIAVDKNEESLKLAKKFGATHTVHVGSENVLEKVRALTGGRGASHVMICTADPKVIEQGVEASSVPGAVYIVSVPPLGAKVSVDALSIHRRRKLSGSYGGGCFPDRDIPAYLNLYAQGQLKLKELISHQVPLKDINEGIKALFAKQVGRCIVRMTKNGH